MTNQYKDTGHEEWQTLIGEVLPRASCARVRAMVRLFELTLYGHGWRDASKQSGIDWPTLQAYKRHYPEFAELWEVARRGGQEYRELAREQKNYQRACEGWIEPVFDENCRKVGETRKYSTRQAIRSLKFG